MQSKHQKLNEQSIDYGTSGFRTRADLLDHILFRMGILASLRSMHQKATIGVMITASHNPEEDNGVKIVDPMGEMLNTEWEKHATKLANLSNDKLELFIEDMFKNLNIQKEIIPSVVVGRDTRISSLPLSISLSDGLQILNSKVTDIGIVTTPQLHYVVRCINTNEQYGIPTLDGYYNKITNAFNKLNENKKELKNYVPSVTIDGANGVGAIRINALATLVASNLEIIVCNDGSNGRLNHLCGADYVKLNQKPAQGMLIKPGVRYASFDGDADRIVYFYVDKDEKFFLMDGDKILTLIASYLDELVKGCGLNINIGAIQTAYANGASTSYLSKNMNIAIECVPTGVKFLHHAAQSFDIGIYFEANGHGTIIYSETTKNLVNKIIVNKQNEDEKDKLSYMNAQKLLNFINLTNETVGDAISDLLLVESILQAKDWNIQNWNDMYTDLPNRQIKIQVENRQNIETTNAERCVTKPDYLQPLIDALVAKYAKGRSFVRPSGTENGVRVYAEADSQINADLLAYEVGLLVYKKAGGCGDEPVAPKQ